MGTIKKIKLIVTDFIRSQVISFPKWLSNVFSTSQSMGNHQEESRWNYEMTLSPKPVRIFRNYAPEKKGSVSRIPFSIVSFQISCVKVVISLNTMVQVVTRFGEVNLKMKTSNRSIPDRVSSQWQTLVQAQT